MATLSALVVAGMVAAAAAESAPIHYTLSPVIEHGALKALDVEIAFAGESDGETELELPDSWGGGRQLWHGLTQLQIEGATRVTTGGDPAHRVIDHAPGATLVARYRLKQIWSGEPDTVEYRPIIRPGYFHIVGRTAFARPKLSASTPTAVTFKGFPKTWSLASDLEHAPLTLHNALSSISVGGDFRVLKAGTLRVAIRGAWRFRDADVLSMVKPIIESHNRFWGDAPSLYLITVLPIGAKPNTETAGGTGLGDAFAFYATPNMALDQHFRNGLAHEHMHTWIPLRVGRQSPEDEGLAEAWLSEGFTDFYTYRLLARDGVAPLEEVVSAINEILLSYAFSSARNSTNAALGGAFWKDPAAQRMPYVRGLLVAAFADDRLRKASDGKRDLDDVMMAMRRQAEAANADEWPYLRANFLVAMTAAGVDFAPELKRFVDDAETIALPSDVWAPCGVLETSEVAEFDRGFKAGKTKANNDVVVGVDPDGPAYAAGLRDGMKILNLDLNAPRDSRTPVTYRVLVDGKERVISYLPQGKRRERVQELKLRTLDAGGRSVCAARLAGTG